MNYKEQRTVEKIFNIYLYVYF
jgi:hypothetical protein